MQIDGVEIDDVLRMIGLMAAGLTDHEIGQRLGWSTRTVRRRIARLFTTIDAINRFQAGHLLAQRSADHIQTPRPQPRHPTCS